jgi:hypothetical protein
MHAVLLQAFVKLIAIQEDCHVTCIAGVTPGASS